MKNMKNRWRAFAALSLIAALAACGGYTTVSVGGTVSGLTTQGLVIANNGESLAIPKDATSYTFPTQIDSHGRYSVSVVTQPPKLTCAVSGASGLATGIAISTANVYCTLNNYSLGGTISGLTSEGLKLTNGSDYLTIAPGAASFTFTNYVPDGTAYAVTILQQPEKQKCEVSNGVGTMASAKVENVTVVCK